MESSKDLEKFVFCSSRANLRSHADGVTGNALAIQTASGTCLCGEIRVNQISAIMVFLLRRIWLLKIVPLYSGKGHK